jgi:hypothetical protein
LADCLLWADIKNFKSSPHLSATFFQGEGSLHKMAWARYILDDFVTNPSGHPDPEGSFLKRRKAETMQMPKARGIYYSCWHKTCLKTFIWSYVR